MKEACPLLRVEPYPLERLHLLSKITATSKNVMLMTFIFTDAGEILSDLIEL